jgi:LacI family repressor for deo operon, udp, cdd, tsx, nupC, and nupG
MAISFIKTVRSAGVRIPEDVSVVGFDGIEFADYAEPTLTTLQQPLYELERAGARTLLGMIRGTLDPADRNIRLPLRLLERDTTGPAPGSPGASEIMGVVPPPNEPDSLPL